MIRFFCLLFISSTAFCQNNENLIERYIDSAREVTNKFKDFDRGLYYIDKAIEIDSNYKKLYETKLRYQMSACRFDEAIQTTDKLLLQYQDKSLYSSIKGLLLEHRGDTVSALNYYRESEEYYKSRLDTLPVTGWLYEFVLMNRVMNLLFLREDSIAKRICVEYFESHRKTTDADWLNRILKLDRNYYLKLFFGVSKVPTIPK